MSEEGGQRSPKGLEALLASFSGLPKLERLKIMASKVERRGISDFYNACLRQAHGIEYTSEDINVFLSRVKIKDDQRDELGIYTSALINNLVKENETVNLDVGGKKPHFLGSFLSKGNLYICGNLGNFACYKMSGGHVILADNAGDFLALQMEGGIITAQKYTGEKTGAEMSGGEINVSKTAGLNAGEDSTGGTIRSGSYASIGDRNRAKLYLKGNPYPGKLTGFLIDKAFSRTTRKTVSRASLVSIIPSMSLEAIAYVSDTQNALYRGIAEEFFAAFVGFVLYGLAARAYTYAIPLYRQRRIDTISENRHGLKYKIRDVFRAAIDIADYLT